MEGGFEEIKTFETEEISLEESKLQTDFTDEA